MGVKMRYFKQKAGSIFLAPSLVGSLFVATHAVAQVSAEYCGSIAHSLGPFDYRQAGGSGEHRDMLATVEGAHFTQEIELLIRGRSGGADPGADMNYTLLAYPNHHRALISVMRYGEKKASPKPPGLRYEVECYFERAIRFRPDDAIARIIYATYLTKNKRVSEAVAQLEQATRIAGENAFTHYNVGLAYLDMKIYDKSLAQAHKALALGFERTELRDLLQKVGQWKDPVPAPADTPASAPQ